MAKLHQRFGFIAQLLFLSFALVTIYFVGSGYIYKPTQKAEGVVVDPNTLPAFPGAQGFGSMTKGGRGGRVIEVTNLNNSGMGSFRQAVAVENGPRIVVFRVGGIINLTSNIEVVNPFLTVAGQTAPGNGIVLQGARLGVRTHDVIIRGMKVRPGEGSGESFTNRDGIAVTTDPNTRNPVYNVIIDHNSISWATDENAGIWDNTFGTEGVKLRDVTYSWNIITEALRCGPLNANDTNVKNCSRTGREPYDRRVRGFGFIIGEYAKNLSVHHNLIANNDFRNPAITQGVSLEFVNNVLYNYGLASMSITSGGNPTRPDHPVQVDIIGNYFKPTAGTLKKTIYGVANQTMKGIEVTCSIPAGSKIYVKDNIDTVYRSTNTGDQWNAVYFYESCNSRNLQGMKSTARLLPTTSGLLATDPNTAYANVLDKAGARTQGLDSVDARAIRTTRDGTSPVSRQIFQAPGGRNNWFIDSPEEAGGLPSYPTTQATQADNDHDGMPDSWEQSRGGDLSPSANSPSGYTWVEEYINSLISGPSSTTPRNNSPTVTIPNSATPTGRISNSPTTRPVSPTGVSSLPSNTPTSGQTQTGSLTLPVLMDAYVDGLTPDNNYNGSILASQLGSKLGKQIAYLKFDLTSVTTVQRAVLRIRVSNSSVSAHTVHETSNEWGEATITYNTRKSLGSTLASFTPNTSGWREIDLTNYINTNKGLSRASIAIQTVNNDDLEFYSSEGQYPPELVITY